MMKKKAFAAAGMIAVAALALTGCSEDAAAPEGPTTITFWHGYTEADGDVLATIVDDFNSSQDEYVVETEVKTWAVIDDTLLPALSSDEGPDVVAMPGERLPVYADRGAFVDLTDFYSSPESNTAEVVPQAVDMVTVDGKPYGVPAGFVPLAVFYNKTLFESAGINEFPTTWDEWVDVASTLTVDEDGDGTPEQYGVALPDHATVANGLWPSLFVSGGGEIVVDGTEAVIDSPENAATLEYWTSAVADKKISPTGLDGIGADELFSAGKAAMHVGGPWMASIAEANDIDYAIAAIPAGPAEQAASAIGIAMAVTTQADDAQVKGAEAFFSYFLQKDVAVDWSLGSGWPPLRTDIPVSDVAANPVVVALSEISSTGRALLPGVVNSVDVLTAVDTLTQKSVAGGDIDDLLGTAQSEIQEAVN
ncbi:multiple sugar transport system substrate-binding protein [Microbacterium halimionae]|uniref:Multiple sugar transport system substrate-binding protein n=1 Tax=Microbacterium halimionae TaxID=1526413 RepID=A0A7W3PKQ4_9MICO|nr:ABC transporter substrate-binding protein [Microbacterium halimionae]MBA8815127.1 multiple sugar transport system substrate-binding protein [Microbacterium halimionae]NII94082.1 multiple sugar transport system substrate-binding protein [Microbacterium halimionae]